MSNVELSPVLIGATIVGLAALCSIVHSAIVAFHRPTASAAPAKAPTTMTITLPAVATLEAYAADPIVQSIVASLLNAVADRLEAQAAGDPALLQIEQFGFALAINRLKALATAAAPPAATVIPPAQ